VLNLNIPFNAAHKVLTDIWKQFYYNFVTPVKIDLHTQLQIVPNIYNLAHHNCYRLLIIHIIKLTCEASVS